MKKVEKHNKYIIHTRFVVLCVALMVLLGAIAVWHIDRVMQINIKYTEDGLNQMYEIRLEMDDLRLEIEKVKEMYGEKFYLSENDRKLVEGVIMAESRGEPFLGQVAIAQVMRDRATIRGENITTVLLMPNQFAEPHKGTPSESARQAVKAVFDDGKKFFPKTTTSFHSSSVSPDWGHKVRRGAIGRLIFYQ